MNLLRMETVLVLYAEKTQTQGILDIQDVLAILHDHVEIGPVTEIEVFESAGALVLEVQGPSQQQGHVKSWVRISRGIEQYARQSVPEQY